MLCAAELEKDMIGLRTKEGLRNRRANGQTNSRERFGYTNISKGKEGKEIVNEKEIEILRVMNDKRELGYSYAKIAKHLNDNQLYTKKGTKWFHGNIPKQIEQAKLNKLI
jgi:DNA invertase Pin-like site-specific DNA recombinase